jgi:hypothetical protein
LRPPSVIALRRNGNLLLSSACAPRGVPDRPCCEVQNSMCRQTLNERSERERQFALSCRRRRSVECPSPARPHSQTCKTFNTLRIMPKQLIAASAPTISPKTDRRLVDWTSSETHPQRQSNAMLLQTDHGLICRPMRCWPAATSRETVRSTCRARDRPNSSWLPKGHDLDRGLGMSEAITAESKSSFRGIKKDGASPFTMVPLTAVANMVSGHSHKHDRPPMERHNGSALRVGSSCRARSPVTLETSRRRRSMCRPLGLLEQDAQERADLAPAIIARGGGSGLGRDEGMACTAPARGLQRGCMVTPSQRSIEVRRGRRLPVRESDRSNGLSSDAGLSQLI